MVRKSISILIVFLMMSPLLTLAGMTPQNTALNTQNAASESDANLAATDLGRVTVDANGLPNKGFENWSSPHNPENLYTTRSTEEASWYETTLVYEGARSFGMQARAIDPTHYSDVRLTQQSWIYWNDPLNTTLDFDWYLDEIGNPVDQDYYMMQVRISSRNMYYYIGCTQTGFVNGSYGYIYIDGPTKTWNHIHLNLTSDYIELFGNAPTEFQTIQWFIRSYSDEYTRVYMDDVNLINGTTVKVGGSTLNGNFESNSGGWTFQSSYDPADVSQSAVRHEGDWSMNITVLSYNYTSYASAAYYPYKLLASSNQGQLSFWWRINDWVNPTENNYARMMISVSNATSNFEMYYYFALGGSGTLPIIMGDTIKAKAAGFNATNTWSFFDRNIWEDFASVYDTENLWIDEIELQVRTTEHNSRLSFLIDDASFQTSILNDMDYEHQNGVGTAIQGWTSPPGSDYLTVTNFAAGGEKAANLTLVGDVSYYEDQAIGRLPINSNTELILDFNVYLESFNMSSQDFILFQLQFEDKSLYYVIANSTNNFESEVGEESVQFIVLQDAVLVGEWLNFQLDIVHDYEQVFGIMPDTYLTYITMLGETGIGSKLVIYLDDLYIYYDPAPSVSNVQHQLFYAPGGGPATALITATAVDATLESVSLNFRVDNGVVQSITMSHVTASTYAANITNLVGNRTVEYTITATDAFGKSTTALNGTDYYRFSVSTEGLPVDYSLVAILVAGIILAIGVVFLVYVFVYKKK
jgi:hypothetical protein